MTIHPILLDDIAFSPEDETLAFPFYNNLVDPLVVTERHRRYMQLEPAFQFLDERDADSYEFHLHLRPGAGIYFASRGGQPIFREANGAATPSIKSVHFPCEPGADPSFEVCVVRVEPGSWTANCPRVASLRIFCNRARGTEDHHRTDGVSISLIAPGFDDPATAGVRSHPIPSNELEIDVRVEEHGDLCIPIYSVFKELLLPPGLALELALRMSEARPAATLLFKLPAETDMKFRMPKHGMQDDVEVDLRDRNFERPPELSRVVATTDRKMARFTWNSGLAREAGKHMVFGFTLKLEKLFGKEHQSSKGLDIDPVLFNDPPPIGPEYA